MLDSDITFITTSIYTKWLDYSQKCISKYFPGSKKIIVDGKSRWPVVWFDWLKELPNVTSKWIVHIDEDCFLSNREEIEKLINIMEKGNYSVSGVSDAYHHYRNGNPIALNSFFMICKTEDLLKSFNNFDNRNLIMNYIDKFGEGFSYPHEIMGGEKDKKINWEPYYSFYWTLLNNGFKLNYLYPGFDEELKATVPRIDKNSPNICLHMWYVRGWNSEEVVYGMTNKERYKKLEERLN